MSHRQMVHKWCKGIVLMGMACCLTSCETTGGDGCGGTGSRISCVGIASVSPTNAAGGTTSNVDAVQNVCSVDTQGRPTLESFTDHNATVTFTNTQFQNARNSFDVRIVGFTLAYRLNDCPRAARGCPSLTGFTQSQSLLVPTNSSTSATFPLVPLRVKNEYVRAGGETGIAAPSYNAVYTFTVQTVPFNDTFTIEGEVEFTITDFNNC